MTLHRDQDEGTQLLLWTDKMKLLQIFLAETLHTYLLSTEPKDLTEDEKIQVHGTHVALDQACDSIVQEVQRLCKHINRGSSERLDLSVQFENKCVQTFKVLTQSVLNMQDRINVLERNRKEDLDVLINCIHRMDAKIDKMEHQLAKNETDITALQTGQREQQDDITSLIETSDDYLREIYDRYVETSNYLTKLQDTVNFNAGKLDDLTQETSNVASTMNGGIDTNKSELLELREQLNTFENQTRMLTNVIVNVNNRLIEMVDRVNKNRSEVKDEMLELKDGLDNVSRRITAVDESVYYDRLTNSKVNSQVEMVPDLRIQVDNLTNMQSSINSDLHILTEKVNDYANLSRLVQTVESELNDLKKTVNRCNDSSSDSSSDSDDNSRRQNSYYKYSGPIRRTRFQTGRKLPRLGSEQVRVNSFSPNMYRLPVMEVSENNRLMGNLNECTDIPQLITTFEKMVDDTKLNSIIPPPPPLPPTPQVSASRLIIRGPTSIQDVKLRHVEDSKGQYDEVIRLEPIKSGVQY